MVRCRILCNVHVYIHLHISTTRGILAKCNQEPMEKKVIQLFLFMGLWLNVHPYYPCLTLYDPLYNCIANSTSDASPPLSPCLCICRMCCQMSDTLMTHLDVQRHAKYSVSSLFTSILWYCTRTCAICMYTCTCIHIACM